VGTDEQGRPSPPHDGSEAATLAGFLDHQRATLAWKCAGLTDEQLRTSLAPTSMTLGGLLKHCAHAEDYWFAETVGRSYACEPWASADPDETWEWEWASAAQDSGEALRALWGDRVARARAVVAAELAAALGPGAHDRGVRPAQRPRGPAARGARRRDRRVSRPSGASPLQA